MPEITVLVRCIPLLETTRSVGGVVLLRDISELRRRDRLLSRKDATIREIHHRVKNNLQTISSLLRLQGRRLESAGGEGRDRGVGAAHPHRSRSCTRRCRARSATTSPSSRSCGRSRRWSRKALQSPDRPVRFKVEGDAGTLARAASRRRSRSCSPSCCRTWSTTRIATGGPAAIGSVVDWPTTDRCSR